MLRALDVGVKMLATNVGTAYLRAMDIDVAADLAAIERDGYVVLPELLSAAECAGLRAGLEPHLEHGDLGRNNFEGHRTQRVYSLVGLGEAFEQLTLHPRILALCDRLLLPNYLLTASQAIRILPGETAQAPHTDDLFYRLPRPRAAISVSTIWAIDDFTAINGATEIIPGSHRWSDPEIESLLHPIEFATQRGAEPRDEHVSAAVVDRLQLAAMPAGSVIVFLGTLVHRGGANRSTAPRLALSNQYCQPWARQQENFLLSIPPETARRMPARLQEMLGYSIHPPFMGHIRGVHPRRWRDRS